MANKLLIIVGIATCLTMAVLAADCPSSTKVTTCTPKCRDDADCSSIGGKCCPNLCNARSCVQSNLLGNSGSNSSPYDKYSGATGSYCGNVKCSAYEKCGNDPSTKRPKCVRT